MATFHLVPGPQVTPAPLALIQYGAQESLPHQQNPWNHPNVTGQIAWGLGLSHHLHSCFPPSLCLVSCWSSFKASVPPGSFPRLPDPSYPSSLPRPELMPILGSQTHWNCLCLLQHWAIALRGPRPCPLFTDATGCPALCWDTVGIKQARFLLLRSYTLTLYLFTPATKISREIKEQGNFNLWYIQQKK